MKVLKKFLKIIGWIAGSIIMLLLIVILLIQLPAVQNFLIQKATTYISKRTHTKVDIARVGISFPKSLFVEGIYLEDISHDTLLYAERIEVNMDMIALIKSNVHIKAISVNAFTAKISRTENDSLYNFNFLITAFNDSTKTDKTDSAKKKTVFQIDKINLEKIRLNFDDKFGGLMADVNLGQLNLKINQLNFDSQNYDINDLSIDGLHGLVSLSKKAVSPENHSNPLLPHLIIKSLNIKNSDIIYDDKTATNTLAANIADFELEQANLDLNKEELFLDKLKLAQSGIRLNFTEAKIDSTKKTVENTVPQNNWKVTVKEISLNNNRVNYNVINHPVLRNSFDASHINYKDLNISATGIFYSASLTKLNLLSASALGEDGFMLSKASVKFVMDGHNISAHDLNIKFNKSVIDASVDLKYTSLSSIKDSLKNLFVSARLKKNTIYAGDILYFNHQLAAQPFFNHPTNSVGISGNIQGLVSNLKGEQVEIYAGNKTSLHTDLLITGLPDAANSFYDIHDLKLQTGRSDIIHFGLDSLIPQNISLPENINLSGHFKGQLKNFDAAINLVTDFGNVTAIGKADKNENFKGDISLMNFNIGKLLKDTLLGPMTLQASVNGKGFSKDNFNAKVKLNGEALYFQNYTYHNLEINGSITSQLFEGQLSLNDSSIALDFDGLVNTTSGAEHYKFLMNLKGANLQNLNFSKEDLRIGAKANVDLKGKDLNSISGTAGITELILAQRGVKYKLDSVMFASVNENRKSEMSLKSAIVGIKYSGTFAPLNLVSEIKKHVQKFFPIMNDEEVAKAKASAGKEGPQNFSFEIQMHNHPVISEVLLPQLTTFDPGIIAGNFDSEKNTLNITANMNEIVYSGLALNNTNLEIKSDASKFSYSLTSDNISNAQLKLENFKIDGSLQDQKAILNIVSNDADGKKKIQVHSITEKFDNGYKIHFIPGEFFLADRQWTVDENNFIAFGDKGLLFNNLDLESNNERLSINSENKRYNDNLKIDIKNFDLNNLSRIVQKDTALVEGKMNADVLLKKENNAYGIIASTEITELKIKSIPIGNLSAKIENPATEKYTVSLLLDGSENNVSISGNLNPKDSNNLLNLKVDIKSMTIKTAEAFSMGQISQTDGSLTGNLIVKGSASAPAINGSITFRDAYLKPAALNNRLHLVNEKILVSPESLTFNNFKINDEESHTAIINGSVTMKQFADFGFNLGISAKDFLVFNTIETDNKNFYGRMIIDSDIKIKGTMELPVVESKIKLKKGSSFTFAVPEKKLTTDHGENVVVFVDSLKFHPIITKGEEIEKKKSSLNGLDVTSLIEIDKDATLRLLIDPSSSDSLVVKGEASLSFSLDPSGKISLSGTYGLTDGSYVVSLQSFVKRKFEIENGSTILWNGDPLDADLNITAVYSIRTSPVDLVADEISGLSEADQNKYRQRLLFLVYLKLTGTLLEPQIAFEIGMQPQDKGALGGAVNAKLTQLNEDESQLNKQVFALLVLGRFVQENPLESANDGGVSSVARTSVGKFLSAQLNQVGSKVLPGVELNFDVQSYDDYSTGTAEGRTEVAIGVRKQLFNERLSVQVGGTVDVEGDKVQENNLTDIAGDVSFEYKLTKDGRYRLKGYRENVYNDPIEGELIETGAGIVFTRDFEKWDQLFKSPVRKDDEK